MHTNIHFESFLIVSILAFLTPLLLGSLQKIKIPFVVGEILVGILVGKTLLNWVQSDPWIDFLSNLGIAYLLFLSGLEIDFKDIIRVQSLEKNQRQRNSLGILCLLLFLVSLFLSILISYLLHSGSKYLIIFYAILFTASAPGLLVPLLKSKKLIKTDFGQILLLFSLLCEFFSLISITLFSSTIANGWNPQNFLFVLVLLAAFGIYQIITRIAHHFDFNTDFFEQTHLRVRAAFALILILVTISDNVGTEIILGSFLAGVIFSLLTNQRRGRLLYKLDVIGYGFLIPIFFIMVGVNIDLKIILISTKALLQIPILILSFLLVKLIPFSFMTHQWGWRKSFAGGLLGASQLTLIIVGGQIALRINIINESSYSSLIVMTLISCVFFPLAAEYLIGINASSKQKIRKIFRSEKH